MRLDTGTVLSALRSAMPRAGAQVPLQQKQVKLVVALAIDQLCARLPSRSRLPRGRLRIFTNRLKEYRRRFRITRLEPHESMLDIAVYCGTTDPFTTIFTAESEAFARHHVGRTSDSECSDYLWDLFKLLQVPSPSRLFVARVTGHGREQLDRDVARTIRRYPKRFAEGDQIFSLVLPTGGRDYADVRCRGWVTRGRALTEMQSAGWT